MSWEGIATSVSNLLRFLRTQVVTNPDAKVLILIRNDKTGDQFEAADVQRKDLPGFLRRAADLIEKDMRDGSEKIVGQAKFHRNSNAETEIIFNKSPKKTTDG